MGYVITESVLGLDGFVETGPVGLPHVILSGHAELVLISLDQLGHFEVERVGIRASSADERRLRHVLAFHNESSQR